MGNSMKKKKEEEEENQRFEEILDDSVEDVVLRKREWICCSKRQTSASCKYWKSETGFTRLAYVQNDTDNCYIGATPKCEMKMMYPTKTESFETIHRIQITALAARDRLVFSGGRDCVVGVYDKNMKTCISHVKIPRNLVTDACFCGENVVAQVGEDLTLKLWDTRDMKKKPSQLFRGYKYFALGVCTLVEDKTVVTSSTGHNGNGCEIRVWDIRKGDMFKLKSHKQPTTRVARVSHNHFLSASADGSVRLWDTSLSNDGASSSKCVLGVQDLGSPVTSLDCTGGNSAVAVAGTEDGSVCLLHHIGKVSLSSLSN